MASASLTSGIALGSAVSWGWADYAGGLASRRSSVFTVTLVAQVTGLTALCALALVSGQPLPMIDHALWAAAAGLCGGSALIAFWRALAIGPMGTGAAATAAMGAGLPVVIGAFVDGVPPLLKFVGFALALIGIWLVSRAGEGAGRPAGLGLALLSGVGFGLYYVFIDRAIEGGLLWPVVAGRVASSTVVFAAALAAGAVRAATSRVMGLAVLSGLFDVLGNLCFVFAADAGRLDVASVLASLYPAVTVLLARIILKEQLAPRQALGTAAILAAIPLIV